MRSIVSILFLYTLVVANLAVNLPSHSVHKSDNDETGEPVMACDSTDVLLEGPNGLEYNTNFQTLGSFPPEILLNIIKKCENYKDISSLCLVNKRVGSIASIAMLDKLLGAQVEIRIIEQKPVVLLDGFQKQIGIMQHCKRIKELKFDLCAASEEGLDDVANGFLRQMFECARHSLTSFWLACGSNEIATEIGIFDQSPNNVIRLILSDYTLSAGEKMQEFENTFKNINIFEIHGTKFTSIPVFSKLIQFTACQFLTNDISANVLKKSIEAYMDKNPSLKMLKLVAGSKTIGNGHEDDCIIKYLTDLIDVTTLQNVHFADVETENDTNYVIIDDFFSVKSNNFTYIERFKHFTNVEVPVRNEDEFPPLRDFIMSENTQIDKLHINVHSYVIFVAWAGYITSNETKLEQFSMGFGSGTNLVYENGELDIMALKQSRSHFKFFEKLLQITHFVNIKRFEIREKSEVKQSRTYQKTEASEKYVIFENGTMKVNGKDGLGIRMHQTLTEAIIDYTSVNAEDLTQLINNNIDTNLRKIMVLNASADFSIDNENWTKQSSDRVESGFSIQFVKHETTAMEQKTE